MNGTDTHEQPPEETSEKGDSKPEYVERRTVSKKFREITEKCLPGLNDDPAH